MARNRVHAFALALALCTGTLLGCLQDAGPAPQDEVIEGTSDDITVKTGELVPCLQCKTNRNLCYIHCEDQFEACLESCGSNCAAVAEACDDGCDSRYWTCVNLYC